LLYQISFDKIPLSLILQIVLFHSKYHLGYFNFSQRQDQSKTLQKQIESTLI
jgi:hypothetical protein